MRPPERDCAPDPLQRGRGAEDEGQQTAEIVQAPADAGKERAGLAARLARVGYELHELAGGEFLVARAGLTRALPDLRAVALFVRRLGGAA